MYVSQILHLIMLKFIYEYKLEWFVYLFTLTQNTFSSFFKKLLRKQINFSCNVRR